MSDGFWRLGLRLVVIGLATVVIQITAVSQITILGTTADIVPLAVMSVGLLAGSMSGAAFGFEASSFFVDEGNRPAIGQAFIVIDPGALAGSDAYLDRLEVLVAEMLKDDDVRLPGARREALRRRAEAEGIEVSDALVALWRSA